MSDIVSSYFLMSGGGQCRLARETEEWAQAVYADFAPHVATYNRIVVYFSDHKPGWGGGRELVEAWQTDLASHFGSMGEAERYGRFDLALMLQSGHSCITQGRDFIDGEPAVTFLEGGCPADDEAYVSSEGVTAVVLVSDIGASTVENLAFSAGAAVYQNFDGVRADVTTLAHELSHVERRGRSGVRFSLMEDEGMSDGASVRVCRSFGDERTVGVMSDWRRISSFLAPVTRKGVRYWFNASVEAGMPYRLAVGAETAAEMLEMKSAAVDASVDSCFSGRPADFVSHCLESNRKAWMRGEFAAMKAVHSRRAMVAVQKLESLAARDDFVFAGTQDRAVRTWESAQRLFRPEVLGLA